MFVGVQSFKHSNCLCFKCGFNQNSFFFLAYNFRVVLLSHLLLPKITFFFPTTQNKLQFQNSFEPFFIQKLISFYFFSKQLALSLSSLDFIFLYITIFYLSYLLTNLSLFFILKKIAHKSSCVVTNQLYLSQG